MGNISVETGGKTKELEIGDIIQITDESDKWFLCVLIVREVTSWGVKAYSILPKTEYEPPKIAHYRIKTGKFEKVGSAIYLAE